MSPAKELNNIKEIGVLEAGDKMSEVGGQKWGYVVCFGNVVTFMACVGHTNSFGLIFNDFIVETHSSAKSVTSAFGVFAMMIAIGGLLLSCMCKHFSMRRCGLFGSAMFITGSLATVLISNTSQLPFTFGILQGIGFGIMVPVCYSMMNQYFVKKRIAVMSICKAIQGLLMIIYPHALKEIMNQFGFRGTLLILSGISLHTIVGMLVMVPKQSTRKTDVRKRDREKRRLMKVKTTDKEADDKETLWEKWQSFSTVDYLSLKFFKDGAFCNICIGQGFVNFSDISFFVLQPMLLLQYGLSKDQVATCISIGAGADVAGRCFLAVVSSQLAIDTRLLYYAAATLTMLGRIVLLQTSGFPWAAACTGALGGLRAGLHVASPLLLAERFPGGDFPGAYALFLLTSGCVSMVGNLLIGAMRDVYEDFTPSFYGLVACCLPCVLFWPVEYIVSRKVPS